MTDPRIEAVARVLFGSVVDSEDWNAYLLGKAQEAIAAADSTAWRPIADCEVKGPVLVLQGKKQIVAQEVIDFELSDDPVWIQVDGETNKEDCGYLVYLHPAPTHWLPLPKPPTQM